MKKRKEQRNKVRSQIQVLKETEKAKQTRKQEAREEESRAVLLEASKPCYSTVILYILYRCYYSDIDVKLDFTVVVGNLTFWTELELKIIFIKNESAF